ncbi:MAG: hypothetical protein WCT06_07005 [Armatimonadota bacterium]|jgi:hypothetical protein|nr:hypothetical protein [Armatimonadota bacterium]
MEDCPHIDCIDFIELCRQINARPVPWVEMVEIKRNASASGGNAADKAQPKTVGELASVINGLAG